MRAASRLQLLEAFDPQPVDIASLLLNPPRVAWLQEPYIPAAARIWAWGPAESAKSMWAMCTSAAMTREGKRVVYLSQENPLAVEINRVKRTGVDARHMELFHDAGFDLRVAAHAKRLLEATEDASLVVIDTLTACWTGDENENRDINRLDTELLAPIAARGGTVLVIHHTGHRPKGSRRSVEAGRGASSQGQKADVVLEFQGRSNGIFLLRHGKNRMGGGRREDDAFFRVVDGPDDSLAIETAEAAEGRSRPAVAKIAADVEHVIELLDRRGELRRLELAAELRGLGLTAYRIDNALRSAQTDGLVIRPAGGGGPYARPAAPDSEFRSSA